eukprot:CAMPEP_0170490584 /NCGR_PEP_ID=MMETSP0208-20121228/8747_1 /TAXON_ID=197538 /ORGANISM="Strombidium inclinatum, Strain S3" /LENGTH=55 /DNA_ID=CAMNT_0010766019 /DNA_START=184 /DNA_END=347 /DNA_ORIENTATION=-
MQDISSNYCSEYLDFGVSKIVNDLYSWDLEEYYDSEADDRTEYDKNFAFYEKVMA